MGTRTNPRSTWAFAVFALGLAAAIGVGEARAGFIPSDIAGLQIWLDAGDVNGDGTPDSLADGTLVSTWADRSGKGHAATQTDPNRAPKYYSSGIGGMPVVRFGAGKTNSTDYMVVGSYDSVNPYSVFAVANMEGTQSRRLISSNNVNWLMGYWGGQEAVLHANAWVTSPGPAADTTPDLYAATNTGAQTRFYKNGSDITGNPTGGLDRIGQLALAGWYGNATEFSKGDVAEVVMYDRTLNASELNSVGYYLSRKYGIASSYAAPSPATTLTWDGTASNWGASAHWSPTGVPDDYTIRAVVGSGNPTVEASYTAHSLALNGGQVSVGAGNTLTLAYGITSSPSATVALQNGSRLSLPNEGGSIGTLAISGDATLEAGYGTLSVSNVTMASSLAKLGAGTLALQGVTAAAGSSFEVRGGTLAAQFPAYLGQADLTLSGGTFAVKGQETLVGSAPPANPIAYYTFDDVSGTTVYNAGTLGTAKDGHLLNGAGLTAAGRIGSAMTIADGSSNRLDVPSVPLGTAWTIATWFNGLHGTDNWRTLTRAATGDGDHEIIVENGSNRLGMYNNNGADPPGGFRPAGAATLLPNDGWHHIAVVGAPSSNTEDFYIDGVLVGSTDKKGTSAINWIGNGDTGWGQSFANVLDEFRVYGRALSAAEVTDLYGFGGLAVGPVDMTATDVRVTADSAIQATTDSVASFGALALDAGTRLTLSGARTAFTTTAFGAGSGIAAGAKGASLGAVTTVGDASVSGAGRLDATGYDDGGHDGTMTITGGATLALDTTGGGLVTASNTSFRVEASSTLSAIGAGPLGPSGSQVTLAGAGATLQVVPAMPGGLVTLPTHLSVRADSTLNATTSGPVFLSEVSFDAANTLTTTGGGSIVVGGTTLAAPTAVLNAQTRTFAGALDGNSLAATLRKQGAADLVLNRPGSGLGSTTLDIQAGRLVAIGPDSVAGARLLLDGGSLVLGSRDGSDAAFPNLITSAVNGTLTAGSGGVGAPGGAIILPYMLPGNGTTIQLSVDDASAIVLPSVINAPGGSIAVAQGQVRSVGANLANLALNGGTTLLTGNLTLTQGLAGAGTLATQGDITIAPQQSLALSGQLRVESGHLSINPPPAPTPASALGDVRLAPGTQLTLAGADPTQVASAGVIGGPTTTGPMTLSGAPNVPARADLIANAPGDTLTLDAAVLAAQGFRVTGPGTVALQHDLTMAAGGLLGVASGATLATQGTLAIDASAATLDMSQGHLNVAPGTLTLKMPAGSVAAPAGAIGYWPMDETSGLVAHDSAGTHNGSLINMTGTEWVPGRIGNALALNQVTGNNYVSVPDAPDLQLTGDLSIAFWYWKTAEAGDWQRIVGKGNTVDRNYGVWEWAGADGRILFQEYNSGTSVLNFDSIQGIATGSWNQVTATIEGNTARIYINGQLANTATRTGTPSTSADPLTFGYAGIHTYFPGYLDEMFLYNRALQTGEVQNLYAAGVAGGYGIPSLGRLTLAPGTTLKLNDDGSGAAAFSSITAAGGATIQGNATLQGDLRPGTSPGTLNVVGSFAMAPGSTYHWEHDGTTADLVNVTGAVSVNSAWNLGVSLGGLLADGSYDLFHHTMGVAPAVGAVNVTKDNAYAQLINSATIGSDASRVFVTLDLMDTLRWTSTTGTDWSNASHWTPSGVPNAATAAIVQDPTANQVATVTAAMGQQSAHTLIIDDGGHVLVEPGGDLQVANNLYVEPAGNLTVDGTLHASQLNTAGTTTFGPAATLDTPRISVTGGTTSGPLWPPSVVTRLASGTTLRLAGGNLAGNLASDNASKAAGSYAYEIESGTSSAALLGPTASLRKATEGAATLSGPIHLDTMSMEAGTMTLEHSSPLTLNELTQTGGSLTLRRFADVGSLNVAGGTLTASRPITVSDAFTGSGTLVADGNVIIDAASAQVAFGGELHVTSSTPGGSGHLTINVPAAGGIPAGAQAYYSFNDPANPGRNVLGTGADAILNGGAAWSGAGRLGGAISFDGVNDFLGAPLNVSETAYGVSLWFKADTDNRGLFAVVDADLGGAHDRHIYTAGGNVRTRVWSEEIIGTSGLNLSDGNWHQVVHTFGGTVGGQEIYVDGVLAASGAKAVSNFDWQQRINIGYSQDAAPAGSNNRFFDGLIDEVVVYDRALTADDVTALFAVRPSLGTARLDPGTQLTLGGAGQADFTSIGATAGPTIAGGLTLGGAANVRAAYGPGLTVNGTLDAQSFRVTGPGTVTLLDRLSVAPGGSLTVPQGAGLASQGNVTIAAPSAAYLSIQGDLNVTSGTLTLDLPASNMVQAVRQDFDSPGTNYVPRTEATAPGPALINAAGLHNQVMRLLSSVNAQANSIAFDRTVTGAQPGIRASFDMRFLNSIGGADGTAFALLNTANYGTSGAGPNSPPWEEPNLAGSFAVGFDVYPSLHEVSLHWNGAAIVASQAYDYRDQGWQKVNVDIQYVAGGANVSVDIAGTSVFSNYYIPGMVPYESRALFGGRTGGANTTFDVDNIDVRMGTPLPGLGNLTMAPGTQLILGGGGAARFTSVAAGDGARIGGDATVDRTLHAQGTFTVDGDLTLTDGVAYEWDLRKGPQDLVNILGDLVIDKAFTLRIFGAGGTAQPGDTFPLILFDGDLYLNGGLVVPPGSGTLNYVIEVGSLTDPNSLYIWDLSDARLEILTQPAPGIYLTGLEAMLVPEPTTLVLLAFGGLGLLARRRRTH